MEKNRNHEESKKIDLELLWKNAPFVPCVDGAFQLSWDNPSHRPIIRAWQHEKRWERCEEHYQNNPDKLAHIARDKRWIEEVASEKGIPLLEAIELTYKEKYEYDKE